MSLPKRFPIGCCHSQLSRTGHNKHCDAIPKEPFQFRSHAFQKGILPTGNKRASQRFIAAEKEKEKELLACFTGTDRLLQLSGFFGRPSVSR